MKGYRRKTRARKIGIAAVTALLLLAVGASLFFLHRGVLIFYPREISPGIYRATQPFEWQLRTWSRAAGLRSVVNLRGPNVNSAWFQKQRRLVDDLGIEQVDLHFETFEYPPLLETRWFLHALDELPRPLLMHCRSGIDRSGWASAIVLLLDGVPLDEAVRELSWRNAHLCRIETCPLHDFFALYRNWLDRHGRDHTPETFRAWALHDYIPPGIDARIAVRGGPESGVARPGEKLHYDVTVTNASDRVWPSDEDRSRGVRIGVRMLGPFEEVPPEVLSSFRVKKSRAADIFRSTNGSITPGETVTHQPAFDAPLEEGIYVLQFDMVAEMVGWFSDWGRPGVLRTIRVRESDSE
jgi:protein tyrosine phosphatase (PTP) superfamily phosphohydrolase (DUF442 family)